jgi:hypothetical protein
MGLFAFGSLRISPFFIGNVFFSGSMNIFGGVPPCTAYVGVGTYTVRGFGLVASHFGHIPLRGA